MLKLKGIQKTYGQGHTALTVLSDIDFEYASKEFVGIYGVSGTGKSTLLHIMGGLDRPTKGQVLFEGKEIYSFSDSKLAEYRNRSIGFVFQFYHLLPEFSALENVMLPCLIAGMSRLDAKKRAVKALDKTGLSSRTHHKPSQLSGGEQQRVAIARAVIMNPKILLADEPTGNLDRETGREIIKLLTELNKNENMGIIMVTHDQLLVNDMDRKLEISDGRFL